MSIFGKTIYRNIDDYVIHEIHPLSPTSVDIVRDRMEAWSVDPCATRAEWIVLASMVMELSRFFI